MNDDSASFLTYVWQHKPVVVVLLVSGLVIFCLLIVDTYRHRKKEKSRHPKRH